MISWHQGVRPSWAKHGQARSYNRKNKSLGEKMSTHRDAGQNYLANSIAKISMDDLFWREPHNQDVSELTIASRGKKKTYTIENLNLEDVQRRYYLEQLAELIVQDFS